MEAGIYAALLTALSAICLAAYNTRVLREARRDQNNLDTRLQGLLEQLRCSSNGQIRLLEQEIRDVAALRTNMGIAQAKTWECINENFANGFNDTTRQLYSSATKAILYATTVGAFVPRDLLSNATQHRQLLFNLLLEGLTASSETSSGAEERVKSIGDKLNVLSDENSDVFNAWLEKKWRTIKAPFEPQIPRNERPAVLGERGDAHA